MSRFSRDTSKYRKEYTINHRKRIGGETMQLVGQQFPWAHPPLCMLFVLLSPSKHSVGASRCNGVRGKFTRLFRIGSLRVIVYTHGTLLRYCCGVRHQQIELSMEVGTLLPPVHCTLVICYINTRFSGSILHRNCDCCSCVSGIDCVSEEAVPLIRGMLN